MPDPSYIKPLVQGVHHVAIIASDIERSKRFYIETLGCEVIAQEYRAVRNSWKVDLSIPGGNTAIELFTFPDAPRRPNSPEAMGLRHLAFRVSSVEQFATHLASLGIAVEPIRTDDATGKQFTFFKDPDGLPLEAYQA